MANFNSLKQEIDQNVNTNGQQAITGAILNKTLKDMVDDINDQKQDALIAGQNIQINGNVISATGGGSGQTYQAGWGLDLYGSTFSVDVSDLDGTGLKADAEAGVLEIDPNVVATQNDLAGLQPALTAGNNIYISSQNVISATDTTYTAGSGILIDQNNEISADTSVLQPKLTAGSGISISAQNVISATGGGGGGTTYGDGDAIHIDSNDNINVLYGNGLQLDGNGALEVDTAQVASDLDPFGMPFLPLAGGQLQDDPNNTNSTDLNITSPSSNAHIDVYTEDDPEVPSDGIAYIEVQDSNGTAVYGSDGITVNGDKLSFPGGTGSATLATTDDLGMYLPLEGGDLQANSAQNNTTLRILDPDTYYSNVIIDANKSGDAVVQINTTSGTTEYRHGEIMSGSDTYTFPSSSGTIALTSDIPSYSAGSNIQINGTTISATDTTYSAGSNVYISAQNVISATDTTYSAGDGIGIDGNNEISIKAGTGLGFDANGYLVNTGAGSSYVAGNGIDITSGTISVDAADLDGNGLSVDQNGALEVDTTVIQEKLTAGTGITITGSTISATGGGSGLWSSGTGSNSLLAPNTAATGGTATQTGAISCGYDTDATSNHAFAGGSETTASGMRSFAYGDSSVASGSYSVAFGQNNHSSGSSSFTAGQNNINAGNHAVAFGSNNNISNAGAGGTALGGSLNVLNNYEVALGYKNKSYLGSNQTTADDNVETIFTLGNGDSNGTSNSIEVKKNNDVYVVGVGSFDGTNSGGTGIETLQTVINGKQDTLTAGTGISISGNTISATGGAGTAYTAGAGINIDANNEISNTAPGLWTSGTGNMSLLSPAAKTYGNANGTHAVSAGTDTKAEGASSFAIGAGCKTYGSQSFAGGNNAETNSSANTTFAFGQNAKAKSANSFVVGSYASVESNSNYSVAIGNNAISSAQNTYAFGLATRAKNTNEIAFGPFNNSINTGTTAEKTSYTIGNGTADNARSNLIEAKQNNDSYVIGVGGFDGTNAGASGVETLQDAIANAGGGGTSYTAGNGIDITSGTISVDETYLDSVYLPIIGGSLENTSNHTDLRVDAPNSESDNFVDILSPGTGVPSVELGTDTNTQGDVESLKFKGDADIDIKYVGDNTTYTLSFPTLTKNETIATLSDIQGGGGSYLPLEGGTLQDDPNSASDTTLVISNPANSADITLVAETIPDPNDPNTDIGVVHIDLTDTNGSVSIKSDGFSDGTYTCAWPTLSQDTTFATLDDISGGGLWSSGSGTDSLLSPGAANSGQGADASGTGAISVGYDTTAQGDYSFSHGASSSADGDYSFAANNGTAAGDYSASFGSSSASGEQSFAAVEGEAKADHSVAIGHGAVADFSDDPNDPYDAEYGIAIGFNAIVVGSKAMSFGSETNAYGEDSVALGYGAITNGNNSVAIAGGTSNGTYSTAISGGTSDGQNSVALAGGYSVGDYSVSSGPETNAYGYASAAFGFYASTYDSADGTDPTDPNAGEAAFGRYNYSEAGLIFTVGCGYEDLTDPDNPEEVRENAVAIDSDGKIYLKGLGGYTGQSVSGCTDLVSFLNAL